MSNFLAIKKSFGLSASTSTQMLVSRQTHDLPATSNAVVTTLKKHVDFTVSVSFDSDGGTSCETSSYVLGDIYYELPEPTKTHYAFLGWKKADGSYVTEDSIVELSDTVLTADWEYVEITGSYTSYLVTATSTYPKTGIYAAARNDESSPVYIDWGDGVMKRIDGNISQVAHQYSAAGNYIVKISDNITTFQPNNNATTWLNTTSQNRYTLKDVQSAGSHLTSIPEYAFYYCSALSSIGWMSALTSVTQIPSYCFQYCTSLKDLAGIENITSIGTYAFANCTGLSGIDELSASSVRALPNNCFQGCTGLKSISGAKLITSFGTYCFSGCTGLTGTLDTSDFAYTSLPNQHVFSQNSFAEFKFPASYSAMTIGNSMFYNCKNLSAIDLPQSLTAVSQYCLYYTSALKHIAVPDNVKVINTYAFRYSGLSSVDLPSSLTAIASNYVFGNCTSLISVDIPGSTTSIGTLAFYYDSALTSVNLPSSLTSLTGDVLHGCTSLGELEIPSAVASIGANALAGCYRLSSLTVNRDTAPAVANTNAFGTGASNNQSTGYTGYASKGSNILYVPEGATGYDTSYWLDPLQNASKCGFTLQEIT